MILIPYTNETPCSNGGVNGVGKTTTIGKLAYQFKKVIMLSLVQLMFRRSD
jgi:signal recognition particle GTPase